MRKRLQVGGVVQGLGFRPWVYRLAVQHGLSGCVQNQSDGVLIDVQGTQAPVDSFIRTLRHHPLWGVSLVRWTETRATVDPALTTFSIATSQITDAFMPVLVPDLATCQECLREMGSPGNRRYGYVFNSCAGCGPRYSITKALPYDRENTAMQAFPLCDDCQREYHDPTDRRFHAQLISCPDCGPRLFVIDSAAGAKSRRVVANAAHETALLIARAATCLANGEAIAIKGIGGYQILVGSGSLQKLADLRVFKQRPAKPFAFMVSDLDAASRIAHINTFEADYLESLFNSIVVLTQRREGASRYLDAVAPTLKSVGLMLPASPLHHQLAQRYGAPIVVTSANRADEPMVYRDEEIESAVGDFCALIIGHDRPIVAPVDDSVITVVDSKTVVLRAGRGWAPIACANPWSSIPMPPMLALGAQQRNAIALGRAHFFLSGPYTGDLSSEPARKRSTAIRQHLQSLIHLEPELILCDQHPGYESTAMATAIALESGKPIQTIQHHLAHAFAVAVEHGIKDDFLAVTWDGFGYGTDGSLWGGECFRVHGGGIHRVASLLPFPVLGLDAMAKDPRLSALALLSQLYPERAEERVQRLGLSLPLTELRLHLKRVARRTQLLWTSSAGRLIDGVAAMLGLINAPSYDGHAAMLLNEHASLAESPLPVAVAIDRSKPCALIDWRGPLQQLIDARLAGIDTASLSTFFWSFLAETVAHIAQHEGASTVVLGGGCFQGPTLVQAVVSRLEASGITPRWPSRLPAGDGAIALGQLAALAYLNSHQKA